MFDGLVDRVSISEFWHNQNLDVRSASNTFKGNTMLDLSRDTDYGPMNGMNAGRGHFVASIGDAITIAAAGTDTIFLFGISSIAVSATDFTF